MRKTILALNIGALAALAATTGLAQEKRALLWRRWLLLPRRGRSPQDIPISVQAFSSDAIDRLGANSLSDLSQAAPSLDIGGLGKGGSQQWMGMRGVVDFARNVGIDARMGVYIDGVFQGRSYSADVPLLGLESVELLRGPQGTLFGKEHRNRRDQLEYQEASEGLRGGSGG